LPILHSPLAIDVWVMKAFDIAEIAKGLFAGAEQLPDRAPPEAAHRGEPPDGASARERPGAIACTTLAECRGPSPLRNLQAVDISTIDEVGTI
jgi:hypothetical protein